MNDVSTLREQKKGLQNDIAELMSFKARNQNGAPEHVGASLNSGCLGASHANQNTMACWAKQSRPQQHSHPNNNGGAPSGFKSRMAGTFAGPPASGETFSPFGRAGNRREPLPPPPGDGSPPGEGPSPPPPEPHGGPQGGPSQTSRFGPSKYLGNTSMIPKAEDRWTQCRSASLDLELQPAIEV